MTDMTDIMDARAVLPNVKAQSKKQLLQDISQYLAKLVSLDPRVIFEALLTREKLGSTGIGHGVAIPHGKIAKLDKVHGLFVRMANPLDYDAIDQHPVDLVFVLLAPEHAGADHLKALARVSRLFRDTEMVKKLRGTQSAEGLYAILTEPLSQGKPTGSTRS